MTAPKPIPIAREPGDDDIDDGVTIGSAVVAAEFAPPPPPPKPSRLNDEILDVLLDGATVDPRKSESPLERQMFKAFCDCGYFSTDIADVETRTIIYQQHAIATSLGVLRADYAAVRLLAKRAVRVAIELDGHEFHQKTKAQVERDYRRGRAMARVGWIVVRFTGSEVWRNPRACALEIAGIVIEAITRIHEGR